MFLPGCPCLLSCVQSPWYFSQSLDGMVTCLPLVPTPEQPVPQGLTQCLPDRKLAVAVPQAFSWGPEAWIPWAALADSLPWTGRAWGTRHERAVSQSRLGVGGVHVGLWPWGPRQARPVSSYALPDLPVLLPSFITFRSCAYLDKKHTIFGR